MEPGRKEAPLPPPDFTEADIEVLKKYFEWNKRYHKKINEELIGTMNEHPLWGPLIRMQTPEQMEAQNARSLEMQRAAIYEGKWTEYSSDLVQQGRMYARMNVSYADWYEVIRLYKVHLIPYIKKDFTNVEDAITFFDGLSMFLDYAMYGIAEAYFQEKNAIIRENEERFRAIFENSADHILLVDREGVIQLVNHVLPGMKKEDIVGKNVVELQSEMNRPAMKEAMDTVFTNRVATAYDTMITRPEGNRYYSSSLSPVFDHDDEVRLAVMISRDMTAQKESEAKVRELNATLERKVQSRTEELNSINRELESFSYSISHDLRGPLRAINGFTQILAEECPKDISDDAKDAMHEIITNARRMGQLIDDLLEFSRLGKQPVSKARLDMTELVNSVIADVKRSGKSHASFQLNDLEEAQGDRGMLRQVLVNLVSNAVKYSGKKAQPAIEFGSYKENGVNVYFIKDNGAGFDMAYYNKLFGVFQRLHRADEFEGTGVGLAIVQRIIAKHSGKVWAEGKVEEGATFYFSLPNHS